MLQVLNSALTANSAVMQHSLMSGPIGSSCVAGALLGDITRVKCDVCVVPHLLHESSRNSINRALFQAGAHDGVNAFEDYVKSLGTDGPSWGDVFIAESGGANAKYLMHIVGMGAGTKERDYNSAEYQVFAAMKSAMESGFDSILFPLLGMGEFGMLSPDLASEVMFGSIYRHWRDSDTHAPRSALIAIDKGWLTYLSFVDRLREVSPNLRDSLEPPTGNVLTRSDAFIPTRESIARVIAELSPSALYAFYFMTKGGERNVRETCEVQPWFQQVRVLFTEGGGQELHPIALEELKKKFDSFE